MLIIDRYINKEFKKCSLFGIGETITAIGNWVNSGISYDVNKKLANQQFEYNKQLQELAYQQNLEQWNRENEYNLPQNQMARFKQAGLNPNLIYGQSNTSASSPQLSYAHEEMPKFQAPQLAPSTFDFIDNFIQRDAIQAGIDKQVSESELAKSSSDLQKLKVDEQRTNNEFQRLMLESELRKRGIDIDLTTSNIDKIKSDLKIASETIENLKKQRDVWDSQILKTHSEIKNLESRTQTQDVVTQKSNLEKEILGIEKQKQDLNRIILEYESRIKEQEADYKENIGNQYELHTKIGPVDTYQRRYFRTEWRTINGRKVKVRIYE